MFERFKDRPPFSTFDPAVLRDYCEFGLLPVAGGRGFELACPPEIEAGIYRAMWTNGAIHESVRSIDIPVLILRPQARGTGPHRSSPNWLELVETFKRAREVHLAGHTHFIPMEAPDLVAKMILQEEV